MERGREEVMEGGRIYCFSALEQAHLEPWRYKITHSLSKALSNWAWRRHEQQCLTSCGYDRGRCVLEASSNVDPSYLTSLARKYKWFYYLIFIPSIK